MLFVALIVLRVLVVVDAGKTSGRIVTNSMRQLGLLAWFLMAAKCPNFSCLSEGGVLVPYAYTH